MSDVQPKKTIQIAIITSILFLIASGCAKAPENFPAGGRHQIIVEPSGIVLRIDTYNGETFRLANNAENGNYFWERVGDYDAE